MRGHPFDWCINTLIYNITCFLTNWVIVSVTQTETDNNDLLPAEVTHDTVSRPSSHVFIKMRLRLSDSISCWVILHHRPYCIAQWRLDPEGNQVPVSGGFSLTLIVCLLAACCHSDWSFLIFLVKLGFSKYCDPKGWGSILFFCLIGPAAASEAELQEASYLKAPLF